MCIFIELYCVEQTQTTALQLSGSSSFEWGWNADSHLYRGLKIAPLSKACMLWVTIQRTNRRSTTTSNSSYYASLAPPFWITTKVVVPFFLIWLRTKLIDRKTRPSIRGHPQTLRWLHTLTDTLTCALLCSCCSPSRNIVRKENKPAWMDPLLLNTF